MLGQNFPASAPRVSSLGAPQMRRPAAARPPGEIAPVGRPVRQRAARGRPARVPLLFPPGRRQRRPPPPVGENGRTPAAEAAEESALHREAAPAQCVCHQVPTLSCKAAIPASVGGSAPVGRSSCSCSWGPPSGPEGGPLPRCAGGAHPEIEIRVLGTVCTVLRIFSRITAPTPTGDPPR